MTSTARRATPAAPQAANDNRPSKRHALLAGEGAGLPARQAYNDSEKPGVHAQKARIAARTRHVKNDWDGAANDNEQSWPLATALLKEGNGDLLKYALAYRRIYDRAKSEAMLGASGARLDAGVALDRYTYLRPNGQVVYKHARKSVAAETDIPAKRFVSVEEEAPDRNWTKVPKPWNGDAPVNDRIDAQRELSVLQEKLGPTAEPFEMACIDGATLTEVGGACGASSRDGKPAAGRAVCHLALITIRDSLGQIKREALAA